MKLLKIHTIAFMMILVALMASCRDELCYDHYPHLGVSLTWEHEWERDYGMNHSVNWDASVQGIDYDALRPGKPEWVNIHLFSPDGSHRESYMDNDGDYITVEANVNHSLLLYNGDTEYIILSDLATPPKARASATDRSRASLTYVSSLHPNSRTTNPPDILYSAYLSQVDAIGNHENRSITVKMKPLVYTYIIRYEFEYGNEHIALARGALGGMAEAVYLIDGRTSDDSTIILYDCEIKDYGCQAQVMSFGAPGLPDEFYSKADDNSPERHYTLNLEVRLKNGNFVEYNIDVSDQIKNQPRGGLIKVSGLRIEDKDSSSEAGFNITVEDWGEREDIELPVTPE
ncbi:MAG: DUF5119 domain-containing protein [Muribaculaceae bacterium]|nr:DUF5119 domain-containing protein [Muribaculaceae bacterium]MDE6755035.1 DUF5119 domain-containing protein [Muribaculaceae bacterium]